MSLLMEALKRAQQEKQNNKNTQAEPTVAHVPVVEATPAAPVPVAPAIHSASADAALTTLELPTIPDAPVVSAPVAQEENNSAWTLEAAEVKPPKVDFDFSIDFPQQTQNIEPSEPVTETKNVRISEPEPVLPTPVPDLPPPVAPIAPIAAAIATAAEPTTVVEPEAAAPIETAVAQTVAVTLPEKVAATTPSVAPEKVRQQQPTKLRKFKINKPIVIGGVVLLLVLAGAGYYFNLLVNSTSPSSVLLPGTKIADAPPVLPDIVSAVEVAPASVATDEAASAVASAGEASSAVPVAEIPAKPVAVAPSPAPSVVVKPKTVTAPPLVASSQIQITTPSVQAPIAQTPVAQSTNLQPAPAPLKIEKGDLIEPFQVIVQDAYKQYQQGNLERATELYRQALKFDANSRDALLGLAVIAQRQGKLELARQYYRQLLLVNPKDHVAASALLSLGTGDGAAQKVTQLKSMLQAEPQAAHLHFALANEYAAQSRWSEAQQAYFTAYSQAPSNADYAFNLAVSLERLGQPKAALAYYRRAQKIAENSVVSFNQQSLKQRIDVLSATDQP